MQINILTQLLLLLLPSAMMAQYQLKGEVQASESGAPLAGVEVRLLPLEQGTHTDSQGFFEFNNLKAGKYELQLAAEGYRSFVQQVSLTQNTQVQLKLARATYLTDEVLITATRASERTATTYSELDRQAIQKRNFGQDFPFILNYMPSTVVTSDAGAGIGYTGLRIRGTDPTRINVTINGIPLNDAESHGVFWVDLPDIASSVNNVQVQRGVGTSTNGAAAFGASINVQTTTLSYEPYAELSNTYGSFNSWKNTLSMGTGLIEDKFSFEARLSNVTSDGWVDRATSDLKSWFVSGAYFGKKSLLRVNVFSGKERTYQSWWGVPEALAKGDEQGLEAHIARNFYSESQIRNLRSSGRSYNYYEYEDEVDDYKQDHYQLHYALQPIAALNLNLALHYTKGKGFFEQFKADDDLADYGLNALRIGDSTISSTDLVRRRWLDNDFYGFTYSANYTPNERIQLTLGGGYNRYDGDHFGQLIWARFASNANPKHRYYESRGLKDDLNTYFKGLFQLTSKLSAYTDLQLRLIDYQYGNVGLNGPGTDNDGQAIEGRHNFTFFNPKLGLSWQLDARSQLYASFAVSNREPVRSDFIDALEGKTPLPESLYNLEAGYRFKGKQLQMSINYYLMDYHNQLVLTGAVNDVGAAIRENVKDSYRTGIELVGQWTPSPRFALAANATFSQNKIRQFSEFVLDYADFSVTENTFENTDISFSPNLIAGGSISYRPLEGLEVSLLGKYVGKQYLDNTSNDSRALDPFFVSDLLISWDFQPAWAKNIRLGLQINNLFDAEYEPNGYTYSYKWAGELITENFLYPQAGRYALGSLALRF